MRAMGGGHHDEIEGEQVDLREVVVEHHREIFRYARSLTFCDADAEDLAQTAVVRALQRGVITSDPDRAKWYVMRIVANLAVDDARVRSRRRVELRPNVGDAVAHDPTDVEADTRDAAVPHAAFAELPERHREVLRLRFFDDLGYDDVAQHLQTTEHGARQRVYRAVRALRGLLDDRDYRRP
jgi:RNA polymerase sigma-70 factor (ECF subfamily)